MPYELSYRLHTHGVYSGEINKIDIRQHGSGNVGATNVYRVLGKKWGSVTFIFDFLKDLFQHTYRLNFFKTPI
jgi:glycerol-3-phosphate acyltransferase PlsY